MDDESFTHILLVKDDLLLFVCHSASAEDFTYTSLGENIFIEGVNDAEDFVKTREAFTLLGKEKNFSYEMKRLINSSLRRPEQIDELTYLAVRFLCMLAFKWLQLKQSVRLRTPVKVDNGLPLNFI